MREQRGSYEIESEQRRHAYTQVNIDHLASTRARARLLELLISVSSSDVPTKGLLCYPCHIHALSLENIYQVDSQIVLCTDGTSLLRLLKITTRCHLVTAKLLDVPFTPASSRGTANPTPLPSPRTTTSIGSLLHHQIPHFHTVPERSRTRPAEDATVAVPSSQLSSACHVITQVQPGRSAATARGASPKSGGSGLKPLG